MKSIKRGLVILLAVLLIVPTTPVLAEELFSPNPGEAIAGGEIAGVDKVAPESGNQEETGFGEEAVSETMGKEEIEPENVPVSEGGNRAETETGDKAEVNSGNEVAPEAGEKAEVSSGNEVAPEVGEKTEATSESKVTPEAGDNSDVKPEADNRAEIMPESEATLEAGKAASASMDKVQYNTGNHVFTIGSPTEEELVDDYFAEDGSYTIHIPEENPFFPYEVQFTYGDEVFHQWFMTPEDSVKIGEHVFYVSAYFDGTVVTQMSLDVAGNAVTVYPEEKEFTNDGDGTMPTSLLPLEEKRLRADLKAYTPAELTMVSIKSILQGENVLTDTDKIVWRQSNYSEGDDYTISTSGDMINISNNTYHSSSKTLEMIVGDADQLAADNIRYIVTASVTPSEEWLVRKAYTQDVSGNRKEISVLSSSRYNQYYDYRETNRYLYTYISADELEEETQVYLGLSVNEELFAEPQYANMKVYEGQFATAEEAMSGTDITEMFFAADMTQQNAGYLCRLSGNQWVTIVTFDADGNVTGCLPFRLYIFARGNSISYESLFKRVEGNKIYVTNSSSSKTVDGCIYRTCKLYQGYAANDTYYQVFSYEDENGDDNKEAVTGAFIGQYATIAAAQAAGAEDIKDALFHSDYKTGGYGADYSQGVYFTIFVGEDNTPDQEVYRYCITTEETDVPQSSSAGSGTSVTFSGLADASGKTIPSYIVASNMDSYGEYNYLTILVDKDTDLTNLAPMFWQSSGMKLYTTGSTTPEVSGETLHDFSAGYIQYTAAAENGSNSKNYWLQVVKAMEGANGIYINSLADESAGTYVENNVIYSKREMMLDGYHDYVHDIWLANMGTESISALAVELVSDTVELDQYWTLSGNYDLSGFSTIEETTSYGELPNLAKIRIKAKENVAAGADIAGQLTIKSGEVPLIVLALTGTVGDPCITTEEVPQTVKYVPYGTMIQNNNKYSWNKVSYSLYSGILPRGMEIKPNGELYGVPLETGEFTFTVRMDNSYGSFSDSSRTFTLTIIENTNENVEAATDTGYNLNQRIQDVYMHNEDSHTMISQGVFDEFVDLYLDGEKLIKGVDYDAESGSTRITILAQTLTRGGNGTHTLGVEFRTQDTDTLKRAAQNYEVREGDDNDGSNGESTDGTNEGGTGDNGSAETGTVNSLAYGMNTDDTGINYTVEAGDSLWKIAKKFYGSGSYWKKIYDDNAAVLKNMNQIYAGQKIKIYLGQSGIAASVVAGQNGEVASTGVGKKTYTVRAGDTLWKIANEAYGKGWLWKKIYETNVEKIVAPEKLHIGQILMIPD